MLNIYAVFNKQTKIQKDKLYFRNMFYILLYMGGEVLAGEVLSSEVMFTKLIKLNV
jgi:hypothetical protein